MSNWRETINAQRPQTRTDAEYEAGIIRSAAANVLSEKREPNLAAQEAFWELVTNFLARSGMLMYEQPNYDLPHFTTGPMALEQIETTKLGDTQPIPSIQISLHQDDLIRDHLAKPPEKRHRWRLRQQNPPEWQRRAEVIRNYYEAAGTGHAHLPYIELEAKCVSPSTNKPWIDPRDYRLPDAYLPPVKLREKALRIFPETPPPNLKWGYGYAKNWMRIGPPVLRSLSFSDYYGDQTPEEYKATLEREIATHLEDSEREIAAIAVLTDIIQTAEREDTPVYPALGRLAIQDA